jgi:hypothetical protein
MSTVGRIEKKTQVRVVALEARCNRTCAFKLGMVQELLAGRSRLG